MAATTAAGSASLGSNGAGAGMPAGSPPGAIRVLADRKHIQLPRIGIIRTHESTRKLARHLERGTGRILAATITRVADRWYVAFTCELIRQLPTANGHTSTVGVDVGVAPRRETLGERM